MIVEKEAKPEFVEINALSEKPLVVVGIPAYNEERTIGKVVLEAQKHADIVVVCDDGSSDSTAEIAERLGAKVVKHSENRGYGGAIKSVFKAAKKLGADILVTLDGDGQHEADQIPTLIQPLIHGEAHVVIGSRFLEAARSNDENEIPRYRQLGIKAITKLTASTSKCGFTDAQNGFRGYNEVALERLMLSENGMGLSVEILLRARERGLKLVEVPIGCNYHGVEKPSKQNPIRHGASVVASLVKLIVEKRPLVFRGLPRAISLLAGMFLSITLVGWVSFTGSFISVERARSVITNMNQRNTRLIRKGTVLNHKVDKRLAHFNLPPLRDHSEKAEGKCVDDVERISSHV